MNAERVDFFISHAGSDRAWAEWVAWQLVQAGHTVELDVWDWAAGEDFITKISDALYRYMFTWLHKSGWPTTCS